ncbi:hypothetical protein PMAYCL1PPCAC_25417, partial [Pristionchus mayeri]
MGNVTLVFRSKKLRVSKELLAIHSSVFAAMFFDDSAEKNKEEIEIKDFDYENFINHLQIIYLKSGDFGSISYASFSAGIPIQYG